jgi:hypothetical protein
MSTATVEPTKIVREYQATDEAGNPIGKPTRLVADTPEEMLDKMQEAHINATRALARQNKAFEDLRKSKLTRKVEPVVKKLTEVEKKQAVAGIANPATAEDSVRKLVGIESLEERVTKAEAKAKRAEDEATGWKWAQKHPEFYRCAANSAAIHKFLRDNDLEYTIGNLDIALDSIGDQLAQDPNKIVKNESAANNDLPNNEPPNAPSSETERRPPSFGIAPGTGSGARPSGRPVGMTKKDVMAKRKADPAWWKGVLNNPTKRAEIDAILARG